jgi:hypothetical protein
MQVGSVENAQAIAWAAPTCFWDNDVDDAGAVLAAYGTPPIRDQDPLFVDPSALRFDLQPASFARAAGCGARRAGITRTNWAHRKTKLVPMVLEPPPAVCGLSGLEALPLLAWLLARRAAIRAGSGPGIPQLFP